MIRFYLTTFELALLSSAITRLLFVDRKNTDSGNSVSFMLTLIRCWNDLIHFLNRA
ncbi:MAG: hypothetical protein GWP09_02755 [Nitrospiraceae bacterium]|nr:hypothetical protein [Nitrospiraceae bacterium]